MMYSGWILWPQLFLCFYYDYVQAIKFASGKFQQIIVSRTIILIKMEFEFNLYFN